MNYKASQPVSSAPISDLHTIAKTLFLALATFLLLLAPDLIAARSSPAIEPLSKSTPTIVLLIASMLLTLAPSRKVRMGFLAFLLLNQVIWLGCLAYFGQIMTPDQFLLAPFETKDIYGGILAELPTLLKSTAIVFCFGAALVFLHWPQREAGRAKVLHHWALNWLVPVTLVGVGLYWFAHHKFSTAYPGAWTPSIIGPYQSAIGAFRVASTAVAAGADLGIRDQVSERIAIPEEPITVAVIMGESITGNRLGVLGYAKDTTPQLSAWSKRPPPGFHFEGRLGFSGGVATFASVPSFLRMSYWPMQADRRGLNLFDLARENGFKTWYYSAQAPIFLNLAGGAKGADAVLTGDDLVKRFGSNNDDGLVALAKDLPPAPRRFVFFHQRVNHSDYIQHCRHVTPSIDLEPYPASAPRTVRTPIGYDNGLRCYDRNVAGLVEQLMTAPGAIYIFITADHAELMGEGGLWGHSMADLKAATVPYILLTNRPDSEAARQFSEMSPPTTYRLAQTVARTLGYAVSTPGITGDTFFLNTTMPFAQAGYMRVDRLQSNEFRVRTYASNGQLRSDVKHLGPLPAGATN
jgi:glucan phosphoethanolaminetransferase (alkaline phosphatase superfamily)